MQPSGLRAPACIEWLVDAVGEEEAFQFIESAAGQRFNIPKKPRGSVLERTYSPAIVQALIDNVQTAYYQVPMVKAWRARMLARRGLNNNEIALRLGISWRSVTYLLYTDNYHRKPTQRRGKGFNSRQCELF